MKSAMGTPPAPHATLLTTNQAPLATSVSPLLTPASTPFILALYLVVAVSPCPSMNCFGLFLPGAGFRTHSDSGLGTAAATVFNHGLMWYSSDTLVSK
jgi:hypothetical protein